MLSAYFFSVFPKPFTSMSALGKSLAVMIFMTSCMSFLPRLRLAKAGKVWAGKGKIAHVGGLVFVGVGAYIFQVPRHLFQPVRFFLHPQMRRAPFPAGQIFSTPLNAKSHITYLPTQVRGQFYYLYMFEDLYSRKIVEIGRAHV